MFLKKEKDHAIVSVPVRGPVPALPRDGVRSGLPERSRLGEEWCRSLSWGSDLPDRDSHPCGVVPAAGLLLRFGIVLLGIMSLIVTSPRSGVIAQPPNVVAEFEFLLSKGKEILPEPAQPEPVQVKTWISYWEASDQALSKDRPLVVGVGCDPPIGLWVSTRVEHLEGFDSQTIVVSRPSSGKLWWLKTFRSEVPFPVIQDLLYPLPRSAPRKYHPYPGYREVPFSSTQYEVRRQSASPAASC